MRQIYASLIMNENLVTFDFSVVVCVSMGKNGKYLFKIIFAAIGNIAIIYLNVNAIDIVFGPYLVGGRNNFNWIETSWIILKHLFEIGVSFDDPISLLPEKGD